jgi:hypothetical protein
LAASRWSRATRLGRKPARAANFCPWAIGCGTLVCSNPTEHHRCLDFHKAPAVAPAVDVFRTALLASGLWQALGHDSRNDLACPLAEGCSSRHGLELASWKLKSARNFARLEEPKALMRNWKSGCLATEEWTLCKTLHSCPCASCAHRTRSVVFRSMLTSAGFLNSSLQEFF